jgi:hypothetical protein
VPESPKWQYTWKIFDKARKSLTMISSFNSNEEYKQRRLENSKFDIEVLEEKQNQMITDEEGNAKMDLDDIKSAISLRRSLISNK